MKRTTAILGILLIAIAVGIFPVSPARAAETQKAAWLSAQVPHVTKTADLPNNTAPYSGGTDCVNFCDIQTPIGVYNNGLFDDGVHGKGRLWWKNLYPSGNSNLTIYSAEDGYGYVYTSLGPSDLTVRRTQDGTAYTIDKQPSGVFVGENSKSPVRIGFSYLAFSNNGQWMVTTIPDGAGASHITLFNTTTYLGKAIGYFVSDSRYNSGNTTRGDANFAVSDDGRYVASGFTQQSTKGNDYAMRVYDTTTCVDQSGVAVSKRTYCSYKNIWTGELDGKTMVGPGIKEQIMGNPERPLNIRFKDDETITFSAVHDYVSNANYKASTYEATFKKPAEPEPEKMRLLAMGDSYISGEGAEHALGNNSLSHYITGTNTSNNKCHQSDLSYPYLIGAIYAEEYRSVACSGAKTGDILSVNQDEYQGQTKDGIEWSMRGGKEEILSSYIPGYALQIKFINTNKPNTILLSIGGNDIGFADIVQRCVLSITGNSCYNKRSERLSLLKTIYGKHQELTATYRKILGESPSGTKLYVIGYPQVLNPAGNCGTNVHFDDQERRFAALLIDRLNATLKNAAASAGAIYVDTANALTGHRLCDADDDGVNGLTAGDDKTMPVPVFIGFIPVIVHFGIGNESYHPTTLGHQLLAAAIDNGTDHFTKKAAPPTGVGQLIASADDSFVMMGDIDEAEARKIVFEKIINDSAQTNGQPLQILTDANDNVAPGAPYTVVVHSKEVILAIGTADQNGIINTSISLPNIDPGIHSLHIYTTAAEGELLDITQDIFITASADDYDGDGIKNADDLLPYINDIGKMVIPKREDETQSDEGSGSQAPASNESSADNDTPKSQELIILPTLTKNNPAESPGTQWVNVITSNSEKEEVLGVVDTKSAGSTSTKHEDIATGDGEDKRLNRLQNWLVVALSLMGICGIIIWVSKRSKINSDRM